MLGLALVGALLAVVPAGGAGAQAGDDAAVERLQGGGVSSVTRQYVQQFYPLWFVYRQAMVAPHNQLVGPRNVDPTYQIVVAINNDTLYASTMVDFTSTAVDPLILTVPETDTQLSYSVLNLDPYGNIFETDVPSKSAGTRLRSAVYGLVPPGYTGSLPRGVKRIELPYDFSVLIFRVDRYTGTVDMTEEGSEFRAAIRTAPLSVYENDPLSGASRILPSFAFGFPTKTLADSLLRLAPVEFLRQMQEAVKSDLVPPLDAQAQALSDQFDAIFGDGGDALGPAMRAVVSSAARGAHSAILDNYLQNRDANNWIHFTNIGAWGDAVLDRASITEFIQYGNGSNTAAYYHTFRDGDGLPLVDTTANGYVLTFPAGKQPEAERFWSLTAYTPNSIELTPNPANKYLVASYTPGLTYNRDGSLSIYISKTKPDNVPEANWLPVSGRPFNVMLRIYGVVEGSTVADNSYVPPPVVKAGPADLPLSGYVAVEADGELHGFGDAGAMLALIDPTAVVDADGVTLSTVLAPQLGEATALSVELTDDGEGLWVLLSDGRVLNLGSAPPAPGADAAVMTKVVAGQPETVSTMTQVGDDLWVFTTAGRVMPQFGTLPAEVAEDMATVLGMDLLGPIADAKPTIGSTGVYALASDGGVFAYGAPFLGSVYHAIASALGVPVGSVGPDQPTVGLTVDRDGEGYWIVGLDGGVFTFESAFRGSVPDFVPFDQLAGPVNGMVPYGNGYVLVADDGGVFVFSDLPFTGSAAGRVDTAIVDLDVP